MRKTIPCLLVALLLTMAGAGCGKDRTGSHIPKTDAEPTTKPTVGGGGDTLANPNKK